MGAILPWVAKLFDSSSLSTQSISGDKAASFIGFEKRLKREKLEIVVLAVDMDRRLKWRTLYE